MRGAMEVKYDIHSAARAVPSNPLFIQWCKRHMHYFNRFDIQNLPCSVEDSHRAKHF